MIQSPYMNQLQNAAHWAEQLSIRRAHPSGIELFNQQQAFQRDMNALIPRFSELQTQ